MGVSNTRGSAHKTAFAAQMHKKSGQVPDFLCFERGKVSVQELFLVHVWRSPNIDCQKNEVFRQSQGSTGLLQFRGALFIFANNHSGMKRGKVYFNLTPIGQYVLFGLINWNLLNCLYNLL